MNSCQDHFVVTWKTVIDCKRPLVSLDSHREIRYVLVYFLLPKLLLPSAPHLHTYTVSTLLHSVFLFTTTLSYHTAFPPLPLTTVLIFTCHTTFSHLPWRVTLLSVSLFLHPYIFIWHFFFSSIYFSHFTLFLSVTASTLHFLVLPHLHLSHIILPRLLLHTVPTIFFFLFLPPQTHTAPTLTYHNSI